MSRPAYRRLTVVAGYASANHYGYAIPCSTIAAGVTISREVDQDGVYQGSTLRLAAVEDAALALNASVGSPIAVGLPTAAALDPLTDANRDDRFAGVITDRSVDLDTGFTSIIASGYDARYRRIAVGASAWAQESDVVRAGHINAELTAQLAAGQQLSNHAPLTVLGPTIANVVSRVADYASYTDLIETLGLDIGGSYVESRAGFAYLLTPGALNKGGPHVTVPAAIVLDACDTITAHWYAKLADVVNAMTIVYGYASPDRPEITQTEPISVATFGPAARRLDTQLADVTYASARAGQLVGRGSFPNEAVDALAIPLRALDDATLDAVLAAELFDPVTVNLPSPVPANYRLRLTSVTESWISTDPDDAEFDWGVMPRELFSDLTVWADLACGTTWGAIFPAITWSRSGSWNPCGV